MTKINRKLLENHIVTSVFLPVLRTGLIDVVLPARTTSNWIRSSVLTTQSSVPESDSKTVGRKKYIVKESAKPGFPQVIVGDFNTYNEVDSTINGKINYRANCTLNIRILDIGDVTRVSNLAGQVSALLMTTKYTTLRTGGLSRLEWDEISTPGYSDDDNDYNEKQIEVRFEARLTEWQVPQ